MKMTVPILFVFLILLLLAACSKCVCPPTAKLPENGSTVWLIEPEPPVQPGLNHTKVIRFNAATDNEGNQVDTTKVYESAQGKRYIWKISRKSGKPYKKYVKE